MQRLTEQQIQNLHTAIDRARGAGACRYADQNGPSCVIGQLAAIEGCAPERDDLTWVGSVDTLLRFYPETAGALTEYPKALLTQLQQIWDFPANLRFTDAPGPIPTADTLRDRMRAAVAAYLEATTT